MSNYIDPAPDEHDTIRGFNWILFAGALAAFAIVVSFMLSWQTAAFRQASPDRLQQMAREANDRWGALEAQRTSIDNQQKAVAEYETLYGKDQVVWPQGKRAEYQQAMTALRNLETAYSLACGQYKAFWSDQWRDLPAPDDLPKSCTASR